MHATAPASATSTSATIPAESSVARGRLLWLDAVRASALFVVVVGHILMAIVTVTSEGESSLTNVLDVSTWSHWVTWPLQVMPVFFAVGAVVSAAKLTSLSGRSPADSWSAWAVWMGSRSRSLIMPATPLLLLWVALAPALTGAFGAAAVSAAVGAALIPLWFLAVYVVVQALVPMWLRLLRGHRPVTLAVCLLTLIAVVDIAHLQGVPAIGYANFVLVWSVPTLLGVLVQQARIDGRRLLLLATGAVVAAAALIALAGYLLPVVGVTDSVRSNNSPPSLLLACHATAYTAIVLRFGPALESLLRRGRRRRRVLEAASAWSMPVYLWHMTGVVALVALAISLDVPVLDRLLAVEPLTGLWWTLRPLWAIGCLLATAGLVALVRSPSIMVSRLSHGRPMAGPVGVVTGLIGCSVGIGTIVENGIAPTPWVAVLLLVVGLAALHPTRRPLGDARSDGRLPAG